MRQVIFITGASSGIGHALARELAPRSCVLALAARRKDLLEGLCNEVRQLGAGKRRPIGPDAK